jgi:hypothetical protein
MPVVDNTDSLNQIMPHLDTVANVAYLNVSVSNMIRTLGGMDNRSPLPPERRGTERRGTERRGTERRGTETVAVEVNNESVLGMNTRKRGTES